ncbi:MAG: CCA tRNA nucleotidyltransferase [Deltaproteobacteria bacterium]
MENYLKKLPGELKSLVRLAEDISCRSNVPVYVVGGVVRDLMLGVENLDLDIVAEGDAIKLAQDFALELKGCRIIRHGRFGTATVTTEKGLKVDFATARQETYPEPASLPVVRQGVLKDDLARRDFTINAMAIALSCGESGRLIDLFGGKDDLAGRRIRVLHGLSFIDDPTRILRAIRFEQRYGFRIERATLKYLKDTVRSGYLGLVQPHRLRDELVLILKEKKPMKPIKRIGRLLGFRFLSPGLKVSAGTLRLARAIENQVRWFEKTHFSRRKLDTWVLYFMALLDPVSKTKVRRICARFAFRKGEEKRLLEYKNIGVGFIRELKRENLKPAKVFKLLEPLSYETILMLKAKHNHRFFQGNIVNFLKNYNGMRIHTSGKDLQRMGLVPGPHYSRIMKKVLDARLEGQVKTKEDEIAFIKGLLRLK